MTGEMFSDNEYISTIAIDDGGHVMRAENPY